MERLRRFVLGDKPLSFVVLGAPTLLAIAIDVVLRGRALAGYVWYGKLFYVGSVLESLAFWWLPLFLAARVASALDGPKRKPAIAALVAFFGLWVLPLVIFCFPGQVLYHSTVDAYMGRDTLRLGIAFRGTVRDWFTSWAGPSVIVLIGGTGLAITVALAVLVRRVSALRPTRTPALAVVTFVGALGCFWFDKVDSRYLQAATPDACLLHGLVHLVRSAASGQWGIRQGYSLRTPQVLPPLAPARATKPNVLVILTESVRADASCSDGPPACKSQMLDPVVADRISLGKLTTPTPNTFSSCVILWTGLAANMTFAEAHTAPVLWEVARAIGYRTAYITSQNGNYEDFGVFVRRAGIDVLRLAGDLGGMEREQIGAPDERATDATLRFVREATGPYFAVLQLANTHMPYRVDPDLQPFSPHSNQPVGDISGNHNHYRNSVLLQERTLAALLKELRALPSWDDTVVVFLSDHGEQFREHHGLYHNHSLFDEELRIPGWLVAGSRAIEPAQREALASFAGKRTYTQDVHATLIDILGLYDRQAELSGANRVRGRSLLRPRQEEPMTLLATSTAVWEPADARFGAMSGERMIVGASATTWSCFAMARDPGQKKPEPTERCADLITYATKELAGSEVPR